MTTLGTLADAIAKVEMWGGMSQDAALAQAVANLKTAYQAHGAAVRGLVKRYKELATRVNLPETRTSNDSEWPQPAKR